VIIFIFLTTVLSVSVCIRCTNYCDVITKCVCVCVCACRVMMGHGARPWVSDINHPNYIAGRRAVKEGLLLSCQQQHWLMCPPLRLCLFWPDIPRHNSCVFQLTTVLIWSSKQPYLSGTRLSFQGLIVQGQGQWLPFLFLYCFYCTSWRCNARSFCLAVEWQRGCLHCSAVHGDNVQCTALILT